MLCAGAKAIVRRFLPSLEKRRPPLQRHPIGQPELFFDPLPMGLDCFHTHPQLCRHSARLHPPPISISRSARQ